ncbi:flagellar export chaperone FlgN [Gallaecimonas kandeliae]|uniref:flagellar export chaperone FlgN n=1 Tax=Gallaecimonas kandeliae TaxID=3029055 RepID=UPI002648DB05|nr:flagellar export chaperone FlgN [Gallaecimonas kandeliae]WKE66702.1 flagellar export chaperone FlgN [Gallaecimonas kandeliae]
MTQATGQAHPGETLDALLFTQDNQLQAMLALLLEERQLLTGRDHHRLATVADNKAELALRLQNLDQQIATHPGREAPEKQELLRALKAKAVECSQSNAVNGEMIVQLQRRQTEQSELLLRALGRSNRTYNSKGVASSRPRLLGDVQA